LKAGTPAADHGNPEAALFSLIRKNRLDLGYRTWSQCYHSLSFLVSVSQAPGETCIETATLAKSHAKVKIYGLGRFADFVQASRPDRLNNFCSYLVGNILAICDWLLVIFDFWGSE
jgi:hypothetical protein